MIDSKSSSSVFQTCNGKIESYNLELGISMVGVPNWLETKNLRMFSHSKLLEKKSLLRWGKQNFFHMCFNKLDLSEIKTEIFKCHHENWCNFKFSSILIACCSSVAQSFLTLCDSMDCSTPGFPVLFYLPEFAQTHVHWIGDAIQASHPLLPSSPPAFNCYQHQDLFSLSSYLKYIYFEKIFS